MPIPFGPDISSGALRNLRNENPPLFW